MATLGVFSEAARAVEEAACAEVQGSSDATIGALGGKVLPSVDGLASPFSAGR